MPFACPTPDSQSKYSILSSVAGSNYQADWGKDLRMCSKLPWRRAATQSTPTKLWLLTTRKKSSLNCIETVSSSCIRNTKKEHTTPPFLILIILLHLVHEFKLSRCHWWDLNLFLSFWILLEGTQLSHWLLGISGPLLLKLGRQWEPQVHALGAQRHPALVEEGTHNLTRLPTHPCPQAPSAPFAEETTVLISASENKSNNYLIPRDCAESK